MKNRETELIEKYIVEESFPMLMATCVKHMRETLMERFSNAGHSITTEQWIILTLLVDQDGVSQKSIADRSDRTEVATLNLLKKLEQDSLVMRHPDPVDGRCRRVFITSEGRKLQRLLIPSAKANVAQMTKDIPLEDIQQLKATIRKIALNLKK